MAYSNDQNEPKVPISNVEKRASSDLLPRFYRTKSNKKFLQATVDQLTQPGTVKKLNGYIGRQTAKAATGSDIFIDAADQTRQNYQLEPAAIITDYLGNTTFFKDYIDHINHIDVFDGNVSNHSRLNKQEFYSWHPHICWDKFVNYQQYYWLPFGPSAIEVLGQQLEIQSTYTVKGIDETDNVAYLFTPNGLTRNPALRLFRGQTYVFEIDAEGHPFSIKTRRVAGSLDRYTKGVDGYAIENGTITFTVPVDAPDVLFYVSENAVDTGGVFYILDITENTAIDLESDFLGKKTYTIPNGTAEGLSISNGMKLTFGGQVTPAQYETDEWYVEGVGTAIRLVSSRDLEVRTSYNQESNILFDDNPFDQLPFGDASLLPNTKDYITINRASPDKNAWSRYNRWFHQDVIKTSFEVNGQDVNLDQAQRAIRPIIEFNAGIKLYNYGVSAKANIDLIDNFTKDVFSTVEGSLGYNVDGIDLADGMRIIFTADPDRFVKDKIFKVNFINVIPPARQISFDAETVINFASDTFTFATEHGLTSGNQITYLINGNTAIPGLTNRQVYYIRAIDTLTIELHTNKTLTKKVDIFALGSGIHKFEIFSGVRRQINLIEEADAEPALYETVTVNYGTQELLTNQLTGNQGQTYWYNGDAWKLGQVKSSISQPPLFDLFDSEGYSFSDTAKYDGSSFSGNKLFSYKIGTGSVDTELGFSLSYKNINNIGDIIFEFNLLADTFAYKNVTAVLYKNTDVGYLRVTEDLYRFEFTNGWKVNANSNSQPIVRVFKEHNLDGVASPFPIDVYDNVNNLTDLEVRVYVNGKRLPRSAFTVIDGVVRKQVKLTTAVTNADIVTLRCFSKQAKNANGYYEIPGSLQNNPLNNNVEQFTLGEVIDHVDSIIDNISVFNGVFPGNGNLRDIGNLSAYGTRFVQHSGPLNLSLYHLGAKSANIVKALDQARTDYGKFKRSFIIAATESGIDADPRRHVDYVLQKIVADKPKTNAYYLSDMFGYTASNRLEYTVVDARVKTYPLTVPFTLTVLSNKSVNIYLNGSQLIHGRDYVFGDDVFFELLVDLAEDDLIEAIEYVSTDGCFCPATPTKLGLYPKFEPKKYIDDTYIEPTEVIQGHDGSIILAFGDYRDDLILELETRIFNNIKVEYDPSMFDIYDFIPGYNRPVSYSRTEFNKILSKYFFQWTSNVQQDYTKHYGYNQLNSFTYNYRGNYTPDKQDVPASWRGIYTWLLDTDRPHTNPWECLGISVEPSWWQTVYGPAPYTSDNLVLWDDLKEGIVREPGVPVRRVSKFAKPILETGLPVDDQGQLVSPFESGMVAGSIRRDDGGYFVFGDQAVVETAWRRSSYYAFALIEAALLMQPNHVLGRCLDRSRIVRNLNDQIVYSETGLRIRLEDIVVPSTYNVNNASRQFTCGLINYIVDYLSGNNTATINGYTTDLATLTNRITTRLGSFTSQPKYKILLDSKNPSSTGGVFVPEENYQVELNVGSAIKKVTYSGIIVTKFADGFEIRGYDFNNPYFTYYPHLIDNRLIKVGGISESYINWAPSQIYVAGKLIKANNQYYRVKSNHTSGAVFDETFYARLAELPIVGGREVMLRKVFDKTEPQTIAYGTKLSTVQEVADLLQGYGAYLEELGFSFNEFNNELATINNWETSVKEFMFWTTQGWAPGAVLSLSPAANKLVFNSKNSVVNDVVDPFYGYKIFRVDGQKLDPEFIEIYRADNEFVLEPDNTNYGIYGAVLYLVQKEHVVVLDNTTLFNDTIYDQEAGYRQERVKILGYAVSNWNGGFDIPGFIYDQAIINSWEPWTDYNLGDIVKHNEFYYSASKFLTGTIEFNNDNWILLQDKPTAALLPNWDYRAEQFTDFYDLDTDNFDAGQQKIAQHLIGYQNRQYLENIIQNDVSQYKFYQGMIIEKGTQNVLSKLFDVLSADGQESLTFDEEWAFRVGEYGAVDTYDEIEFKLDEANFKLNPQPIELVDRIDPNVVDFVYRQRPSDVYIKPLGYNNDIWPTTESRDYLRTPGYVRSDDVDLQVDSLELITDSDLDSLTANNYIWCPFESKVNEFGDTWNVYKFISTIWKIDTITYAGSILTVSTITDHMLTVGNYIAFKNTTLVNGVYRIASVTAKTFTLAKTIQNWQEFAETDVIESYMFVSQRIDNIDQANNIIYSDADPSKLIWIDDAGTGKWGVYQNAGAYRRANIVNSDPAANLYFGLANAVSDNGNISAIADANGVSIYEKGSADNVWYSSGRILPNTALATTADFGSVMKFSRDAEWLAIAAPQASQVKTTVTGDITLPGIRTYTAITAGVVQVTASTLGIITGTPVRFNNVTGLTGIDTSTTYYVYSATAVQFRIASSKADALLGIPVATGGTGLIGTGTATFLTTVISNVSSTAELVAGMTLTSTAGPGAIGTGAIIDSVDSLTSMTVSIAPASGSFVIGSLTLVASGFANQGYVSLYQRSAEGKFNFVNTIKSPVQVSGELFGSNLTIGKQSNPNGVYQNLTGNYDGSGTGATWTVFRTGANYSVSIASKGLGYEAGQTVRIVGETLDSITGDNDLVITITTVNAVTGSVVDFNYSGVGKGDDYILAISALGYNANRGRVYIYKYQDQLGWDYLEYLDTAAVAGDYFGYDTSISADANTLVVSAPATNAGSGEAFVYSYDTDLETFTLLQPLSLAIPGDPERFGESAAISASGTFIAISAVMLDIESRNDVGQIKVYQLVDGTYIPYQTINSPRANIINEQYGTDLSFMNDDKTLVAFSKYGDVLDYGTVFDDLTTSFDDVVGYDPTAIGLLDIYDRYNNTFIYGETLTNNGALSTNYGSTISVGQNTILVSAKNESDQAYTNSGKIYSYVKPTGTYSWSAKHSELAAVNVHKIKKIYLYNTVTNELVAYLDIVDPTQGKIPGVADQEIRYKTYYDPAIYSAGTGNVTVDDGMNWTKAQVGMLWWDLTRARFLDTQSGDVVYRTSVWNKLYDTASIDIYEWVESKLSPADWNKTADTEKGLTLGISGQTRYNSTVYSIKKRYDSISKTFKETYYFWVKNKKIIPDVSGRTLTAYDVASLIADPVSYGYSCLALTGTNSFSLVNCGKYLEGKNVALNVEYWTSPVTESNYHSQWKLLSTNKNTVLPRELEKKWFHSLVGKDDNDRVVPDIGLPIKRRYGIEFRPRQSMFVNRVEAVKQLVERVNSVLVNDLIVDDYDLSRLNLFDPEPSTVSGYWDTVIDAETELRFVPTVMLQTAILTPILLDGKIIGVNIVRAGHGYGNLRTYQVDVDNDPVLWYGPTVTVIGSGLGAVIKTIVNRSGAVVDTVIENAGYAYDKQTTISVRDFAVLVHSDSSALDSWSIYTWDFAGTSWLRTRSQAYDVRKYWNYIDWYATGYNQFVKIDYLVENTYELVTTDIPVGSIAKVKNVGSGGWLLLEKYAAVDTIDYTQNFKVIGRENGTIQLSENLYKFNATTLGYSGPLFDSDIYDNSPTTELRIILEVIRDSILVDEQYVEYLKLFFASVRYAIYEQTLIDWAFKTSFVKSQHNVGELKQKVTYNSDNLESFEQYIKEVKPYKTKVREYVSNYNKLEYSQTSVSDFDLLPIINTQFEVVPLTVTVSDAGAITSTSPLIDTYPWLHWKNEVGFEITEIKIVDGGSGYITRPVVEINGVQLANGTSAEAKAYYSNGVINRIQLVSGGSRWIKAPTITLNGGLSTTGVAARAVAIIGNSVPRTNFVKIKFDRISKVYEVTELTVIETFTGTGARTQYPLKWSPEILVGNSYVTIDGAEVLRDNYTLTTIASTSKGYTSYSGLLTLKTAPAIDAAILIEYNKDFNHLTAVDRINFYYNPQTGQLGKDLAQLMTGVDYGGVTVTGLGFGISVGWDSLPWFTDAWDTVDPTFDDFIVTVSTIAYDFRMPYVPELDQEINVYVSRYVGGAYQPAVRIDDPNYLTINQTNANALMTSFVGDGEVDIITLPTATDLNENDRVIFRKDTSDGSYAPRDDEYDTQLTGGNLAYSTASGLAADDIIVDGEEFVSPTSSHAPEEVVPGQVMDAVAIKVYHRPSGGCPNMLFNHHRGDGVTARFTIGQYFPNESSIIVKVDNLIKILNADYTIDYQNNQIVFDPVPALGAAVDILSIGFNSANILDLDYFIADGETTEYITKANWLPTITSTVLVNGEALGYILFSTDDQYTDLVGQTWRSRAGIRFENAPPAGAVINYIIDTSGATQTASIVKVETITHNGTVASYQLANPVGINSPLDQHVLVRTGQTILKPASANYFTLENTNLVYQLRDYKYQTVAVSASDIKVYRDATQLTLGTNYTIKFTNDETMYQLVESSITISGGAGYVIGDTLDAVGGDLGVNGYAAKFEVLQVSITGTIQRLELINYGSYAAAPTSPFELDGGLGTGATLSADFEISEDFANIEIKLKPSSYVDGAKLTVLIDTDADYVITNGNAIEFFDSYTMGTQFEITSFYNHNILGVERTIDQLIPSTDLINGTVEYYELSGKLGGTFKLRNTAVSDSFVWVIKNGQLLMAGRDYYLEDDFTTIKLKDYLYEGDSVQMIAFTNTVVHEDFAYMQFKDMLNRVHYKRLNKAKTTRLARDLTQFDKEIYVVDASVLDTPNPAKNVPGIIEINGERIEYFVKTGNYLSQLRRGTLGTGAPTFHSQDSIVQCLGASETIPYKDEYIITSQPVALGDTGVIDLPYIPEINDMEVFLGGYRLKKHEYSVYSNIEYPDSPAGDEIFAPEFSITGQAKLQLNVAALTDKGLFITGTKINVVKRQGKLWNDVGQRLAKSNNPVANFLKETNATWLDYRQDKYDDRVLGGDGNPLQTGSGEPLEY